MPLEPPPDIVLLATEWQPRALIRAQLIETGFDVVATNTWPVMRRHLGAKSKAPLAIVDLKGLPGPQNVLSDLRALMNPNRVLVLTALGTVPANDVARLGFLTLARPIVINDVVAMAANVLKAQSSAIDRVKRSPRDERQTQPQRPAGMSLANLAVKSSGSVRETDPMDVGSALRQAREERSLSLQRLSDVTKINLSALRAIEDNDFTRLPGGIFTLGFLKAYAREVGLDPAGIVQRYAVQAAESTAASPSGLDQPSTARTRDPELPTVPPFERPGGVRATATASVVVIACCYAFLSLWHSARAARRLASARAGQVVLAGPSSPPKGTVTRTETATAGSLDSSRPTANDDDPVLRLALEARGLCWISATADGRRVAYRLMDAGERESIEAHDEVTVRVGDPASLDVSINGSAVRPLGRAGEATTVRITAQNYREFVGQ